MWLDRVSNPGPLALESDTLLTVLRGSALVAICNECPMKVQSYNILLLHSCGKIRKKLCY